MEKLNIELTEDELQTMLFTLKVVKYKLPEQYNNDCKSLYDKFRNLVWKTIQFNYIEKPNE